MLLFVDYYVMLCYFLPETQALPENMKNWRAPSQLQASLMDATAAHLSLAPPFPAVGLNQHNIHNHSSHPAMTGLLMHMQKVESKNKVMVQTDKYARYRVWLQVDCTWCPLFWTCVLWLKWMFALKRSCQSGSCLLQLLIYHHKCTYFRWIDRVRKLT